MLSDRFLPHVAAEIIERPLLIMPEKLGIIADVLGGRIGIDDPRALELGPMPEASRFTGRRYLPESREVLPYALTEEGAAIITITGSLVNRGAWVGASSGLTSYEGLKHQLSAAASDERVQVIILDMETPGGAALGAFEAADAVRAAAEAKPVIAVVNGLAASAGYLLASAASRIVTTPSGITGSIGVRMIHVENSRQLDREGVTPTIISAGEGKDYANPFQPLSAEARAVLQDAVDKTYDQFVAAVAKGRKGLSQKAVRALGAHVFAGQDAVDAGLADEIGTFETVLSNVSRGGPRRNPPNRKNGSPRMSAESTFTQADLDRAVAEAKADAAKAAAAAVQAERERLAAVLALPEARGRDAGARELATTTDLTVEQIKGVLSKMPAASSLAARAGAVNLDLGGGNGPEPGSHEASAKMWRDVVDDLNAEYGVKPPRKRAA